MTFGVRSLPWFLFLTVIMVSFLDAPPPAYADPIKPKPEAVAAGDIGGTQSDPAGVSAEAFDVKRATDTYLAKVPPDKKKRSDAYFEGGYWLMLVDFLVTIVLMWFLLKSRWSARMRDLAERITRFKPLQTWIYWLLYLIFVSIVTFPLTVYEGFYREHKYGLATQTFGPWLGDQAKGLLLAMVLVGPLMMLLFGVVRRMPRNWWILGSVVMILFSMFVMLIGPVYIAPLFNKYTKLQDPKIKEPILSMARANGVPADEVYEFNASRQSTRVSANVSGFLGTERISLNDNLLKRCSPEEIQAVMGHELGHYVLNHVYTALMFFSILIVVAFACLRWTLDRALNRWGAQWGVRSIGDLAVLPLVVLLMSSFFFVLTPVTNTFIRVQEHEADIYGLNAARQPDGEAEIALKLGEYRKLDPGPIEEFIFFDHPSGRNRIAAAMRWKAEHWRELPNPDATPSPSEPRSGVSR